MIPYDIDPSLHAHAPAPFVLEDGFSPPTLRERAPVAPVHDQPVAPANVPVQHS